MSDSPGSPEAPFELGDNLRELLPLLARLHPSLQASRYAADWDVAAGRTRLTAFTTTTSMAALGIKPTRSTAIETTLDAPISADLRRHLRALNARAGMGALMLTADRRGVRLSTTVACGGSGDSVAQSTALVVLATTMHAEFAEWVLDPARALAAPTVALVAQDPADIPWPKQDFLAAGLWLKPMARALGMGARSVSAQVAIYKDLPELDATLVMKAGMTHPFYGSGLLTVLSLPHMESFRKRSVAAMRLNRLEFASTDARDFVGAWSSLSGKPTVVYSSFVPDRGVLPGLITRIALANYERAARASHWLNPVYCMMT